MRKYRQRTRGESRKVTEFIKAMIASEDKNAPFYDSEICERIQAELKYKGTNQLITYYRRAAGLGGRIERKAKNGKNRTT